MAIEESKRETGGKEEVSAAVLCPLAHLCSEGRPPPQARAAEGKRA